MYCRAVSVDRVLNAIVLANGTCITFDADDRRACFGARGLHLFRIAATIVVLCELDVVVEDLDDRTVFLDQSFI